MSRETRNESGFLMPGTGRFPLRFHQSVSARNGSKKATFYNVLWYLSPGVAALCVLRWWKCLLPAFQVGRFILADIFPRSAKFIPNTRGENWENMLNALLFSFPKIDKWIVWYIVPTFFPFYLMIGRRILYGNCKKLKSFSKYFIKKKTTQVEKLQSVISDAMVEFNI